MHTTHVLTLTTCIILGLSACVASGAPRQATPPPTSRPAVPAKEPAKPPVTPPVTSAPVELTSGDKTVNAILDRLEIKGQAIKGLECKLTHKYVTTQSVVEDSIVKEGTLLFARVEPNPMFYIHFEKHIAGGVISENHQYFAFDGEWLTERNDKTKTVIKRQIVRKGDRIDPFKLGKGPFPLPFGQKRGDILANFKVTYVKFELGDPRHTDHLHCVPLPGTELALKYKRVEFYIDKSSELPVRVVTESIKDETRIEVDFTDINAGAAPAGSKFLIQSPGDFTKTVEPLDDGPPLPTGAPRK